MYFAMNKRFNPEWILFFPPRKNYFANVQIAIILDENKESHNSRLLHWQETWNFNGFNRSFRHGKWGLHQSMVFFIDLFYHNHILIFFTICVFSFLQWEISSLVYNFARIGICWPCSAVKYTTITKTCNVELISFEKKLWNIIHILYNLPYFIKR